MRTLEEIKTAMESCVEEIRVAVAAKDDEKLRGLKAVVKTNNDDYKKEARIQAFYRCSKADSPYKAAIMEYNYEVLQVHLVEDGVDITDAEITSSLADMDLDGLYRYINSGLKSVRARWADALSVFYQLLVARACYKGNFTTKQIESLLGVVKAKEVIDLKNRGENPCSNTELTKAMQAVVDAVLFIPGDKNPNVNKIRMNKNDVEMVLGSYLKMSNARKKSKDAIGRYDVAKENVLLFAIVTQMHLSLVNKKNTIGVKTKKDVDLNAVYAEMDRIGNTEQKPAEVSALAEVSTPAETKVTRKSKSQQKPVEVSTPAEV